MITEELEDKIKFIFITQGLMDIEDAIYIVKEEYPEVDQQDIVELHERWINATNLSYEYDNSVIVDGKTYFIDGDVKEKIKKILNI